MLKNKFDGLSRQNKKFILVIISLLEVILIVCTTTYSWIEGSKKANVMHEYSSVSPGAGLIFRDLNGNILTELKIPEITLSDCSSVDGREFFFPVSNSFGENTSEFVFRSGTDADVNTKYISQDFYIESYTDSQVYISEDTSIIIEDKNVENDILNALRISINFNDGTDPVVFCPTNEQTYTREYKPVISISGTGEATCNNEASKAVSFSDYHSNKKVSLTKLAGNTTKRVTFSMWLEGTDLKNNNNNYIKDDFWKNELNVSDLSIKFILTSVKVPLQTIRFCDYSPNIWVDDDNTKLFAIDKSTLKSNNLVDIENSTKYYMLPQSDGITYEVEIPETVGDIAFARYNPNDQNTSYNVWAFDSNNQIIRGDSDTYYAIGQGEKLDGANIGYWVSDDCKGVIDFRFTDSYSVFTKDGYTPNLYFKSTTYNTAITNVGANFKPSNDYSHDKNYGLNMTHCGYNGQSKIYRLIIPADAKNLVINSGSTNDTYSINNLSEYFNINSNGYNKIGFWYESDDSNGTWNP